jgi:Fe-S oxidoreductase
MEMSIHDACPTRTEERVHTAIRRILERMNIKVIEPDKARTKAECCGDSFYGALSAEQVKEKMKKRASEMPCENVVVYCVSCIKAMYIGGKRPRYMVDLLFGEDTEIGTFEPDLWHAELQKFIDQH